MRKYYFRIVCYVGLSFLSLSCAANQEQTNMTHQEKEIRSQYKEEVSAIYKECQQQKHGIMLNCIQNKIQELGEDVELFDYSMEIKYASNWKAPEEYANRKNNVPGNKANLIRGEEIFQFYCSACHGKTGQGRIRDEYYNKQVADLTNPKLLHKTDGAIFWKITEGDWPMPAFWEGDELSENDLWMLIHYLRTLAPNEE